MVIGLITPWNKVAHRIKITPRSDVRPWLTTYIKLKLSNTLSQRRSRWLSYCFSFSLVFFFTFSRKKMIIRKKFWSAAVALSIRYRCGRSITATCRIKTAAHIRANCEAACELHVIDSSSFYSNSFVSGLNVVLNVRRGVPGMSLAEGKIFSCICRVSARSSSAVMGSSRASRIVWQAATAFLPITDDFTSQVYCFPKRSQISWKDTV